MSHPPHCHQGYFLGFWFPVFLDKLLTQNKLAPTFITCPLVIYIQCKICMVNCHNLLFAKAAPVFRINSLISHKNLNVIKINDILRRSLSRKSFTIIFHHRLKSYALRNKCFTLLEQCCLTSSGSLQQFLPYHIVSIFLPFRSGLWPSDAQISS